MEVRLTTLGPPSVHVGDQELAALPGKPVSFGLLVFLALEGEVTRDRLLSVFWPDKDQERARHTLSQTLYELRRELGEAWIDSVGSGVRVTPSLRLDTREFESLASEARYGEALALYTGHFLDGVHLAPTHPFQDWTERHRARLRRKHRAVADAFITAARARGDMEQALGTASGWVTLEPLDDGAQHHLIQLLAEAGRRAEALAQYERYERFLETELGLEPMDETRELVDAVRSGTLEVPPSAPTAGSGAPATEDGAGPHAGGGETPPAVLWPPPFQEDAVSALETNQVQAAKRFALMLESEIAPSLQLLRPIGKGNMAEVFLAREPHLKRLVAVKVLSPRLARDPQARRRFQREAQAAARLHHPHICTVHRVGSLSDGTPYLVSPYVRGSSLAQRLKAHGRSDPSEVRRVLRDVASALAAAHKIGVIHRDVRPDNVLRSDEDGQHFLCDFGIAGVLETGEDLEPRITRTDEILGNPAYISPEQMDGRPLTDRADLYSLGVLAHQLLTGHLPPPLRPRDRAGEHRIVDLRGLDDLVGSEDPFLADLVGRCLARDPAHRPSAADVVDWLGEGDLSRPHPAGPRPRTAGGLLHLLLQRRFLQIIGAYLAGSWLALEAADQLEARGILPPPTYSITLITVIFGFLATGVLAWFHGQKGRQSIPMWEKWLLSILVVGWLLTCTLAF